MLVFLGDVHGDLGKLVEVSHHYAGRAKAIIQVGDLGCSRKMQLAMTLCSFPTPIYWIDGECDAPHFVRPFWEHDEPAEIAPNVFYMRRGLVATLDGRRIGFLGGAASVQHPESVVTGLQTVPLVSSLVDLLVTHVPPSSIVKRFFPRQHLERDPSLPLDWTDPSAIYVQDLWEGLQHPPLICGHVHRSLSFGPVHVLDYHETFELP